MLVCFAYLFFVAWSYNFSLDYYKCDARYDPSVRCPENLMDNECAKRAVELSPYCKNPFYEESSWKNIEYLTAGEYGTKLGPLFNSVNFVIFSLFILAFIINHYVYNKGKKIITI
jgi:hypothetical protein